MSPITPGVVAGSRVQQRQEHGYGSPPDLHPAHAVVPTLRPSLPTDAPSGAKVGPAKIILASARSPRRRHAASDRTTGAGRLAGTPERFWRCADAAPPPSAHGWGRGVFLTAHRPQQLARTLMRPRRAGNRRNRRSRATAASPTSPSRSNTTYSVAVRVSFTPEPRRTPQHSLCNHDTRDCCHQSSTTNGTTSQARPPAGVRNDCACTWGGQQSMRPWAEWTRLLPSREGWSRWPRVPRLAAFFAVSLIGMAWVFGGRVGFGRSRRSRTSVAARSTADSPTHRGSSAGRSGLAWRWHTRAAKRNLAKSRAGAQAATLKWQQSDRLALFLTAVQRLFEVEGTAQRSQVC